MEKPRPGPGHTSSYGQACMQCYKAKCRCVPHSSGDGCERCLRLKKDCQPSGTTRKRNGQKNEESDVRIAHLEGKIETLLSAVQSMVNSSAPSAEFRRLLDSGSIPSSTSGSKDTPANSISTSGGPTPATDLSPMGPNPFSQSPSNPSAVQPDECLGFFRSRMLPCFPFINLTPDITARQLYQDRPFLFQAILTVTTFSTQRKLALVEELKRILFTSALLNLQSNIDLLLGLLTYLAWSTDAFLGRADLVSRLMMLAISLVYDLRLFKPSPPDVKLVMTITQGRTYENDENTIETVQLFMEKQRALLACFVLSSNISSHLGRVDALRWTPQMEEALRLIEMNKSCPTDEAFAFQVRLQLLKQRAAYVREQNETDRAHSPTASVTFSVPGLLYLKTLLGQLHELRSSIPPDLPQRGILITYGHYVELYINQLGSCLTWDSVVLNPSGQRTDVGVLPGFERLESLWRSVESIKSLMDNFYNIPPSELVGLPFHFWSQMILCITVLKYLSVLEDPAWDRRAVQNTVDIMSTMEYMIQKLELTSQELGLQCDDNLFRLLSKLFSKCQVWAAERWNLASQLQDIGQNADPCASTLNSSIPDLDQMIWMQSMDLESDQWFDDMMGWPTTSV
ncbi:hypothetical protein BGW36DRAFT_109180 [Talaromyces proteolyticus]|uniref:Zn(2)-C6 fungal-type domain-containing protein n=1 Tax=Talaromyces proteolyticus TaxID=1131652 RepID=A0AAD4L165_9EURO|nr:uncharacterized protein BGW36DRAFT_109180 [Talaromyces proteolyticus]KAH8701970.1 hypothetical protein BGW36DRAFT_109180 [Talaromyces proteolyticus]